MKKKSRLRILALVYLVSLFFFSEAVGPSFGTASLQHSDPPAEGACEQVILTENFENETTGQKPKNWNITNATQGSFVVDESVHYGQGNKSGFLTDNSTVGSPLPYRNFKEQNGTIVATFAVRPAANTGNHTNLSVFVDDGHWCGANIWFTEDGTIGYKDNSGIHILRSYSANRWYNVKLIMNIPENLYNIHINNHLEAEWVRFNRFGVSEKILRIVLHGPEAWRPIGYVDEIEIRKSIKVPEDFPKIQEAIEVAHSFNTICLASRTYYECIRFENRFGLKLIGDDRDKVILDGGFDGSCQSVLLIDKTSSNITIQNITIRNADKDGIRLKGSNNTIINVNVTSSLQYGIHIEGTGNTIKENVIMKNVMGVMCSLKSQENDFYYNKFVSNDYEASDDGKNTWDHGYPFGGNYWSDYQGHDFHSGEKQCCPPNDGIGDTPYIIDYDTKDNYPLYLIKPDVEIKPDNRTRKNDKVDYNEKVTIIAPKLHDVPIHKAQLHLSVDGVPEEPVKMEVKPCELEGTIRAHPWNSTILFYINATNIRGSSAISTNFSYTVLDTVNPKIRRVEHDPNENGAFVNQRVNVTATVREDINASGVEKVILTYTFNNGTEWSASMIYIESRIVGKENQSQWELQLPYQPANGSIAYSVLAFDKSGNSETEGKTYTVLSPPYLTARPPILDFDVMSEGEEISQYFNLRNDGEGDLNWNITRAHNESWIRSISPNRSPEPLQPDESVQVKVTVDTDGLSPCDHVGMLNVSWMGESNTTGNQMVYVYLTVRTVWIDKAVTSRSRCDIHSREATYFHAVWGHDPTESIQDGTITVNATCWDTPKDFSLNSTGWISFIDSHHNVVNCTYEVIAVECPYTVTNQSYQITSFTTLAPAPSIIWDRVDVKLKIDDDRIDVCDEANITYQAVYQFDNTTFYGSINLNNTRERYETVGKRCYTVASISDPLHELTEFTSNTVCCIWDAVEVVGGGAVRGERDSAETVAVWFVVVYEYDGELLDDRKGQVCVNITVDGSWSQHNMTYNSRRHRWERVFPAGIRTFKVSKVIETKYGLTTLHDEAGPIQPCPDSNVKARLSGNMTLTNVTSSATEIENTHATLSPPSIEWMNLAVFLNTLVGILAAPVVFKLYLRRKNNTPFR